MIKSIELTNFKKYDNKRIELKGVDVVAGLNGAGKSSVIQGIIFSTLGYVPGVDKKSNEIMKLSKNSLDLGVKVEVNNEFIERKISIQKGGKCKEELYYSGTEENKLDKKNEEIISNLGINKTVFDIENFLVLSSTERSKLIYSLVSNNSIDKKFLETNLYNNLPAAMAQEVLEDFDDSLPIESNIDNMLSVISTSKRLYSREIRAMESTTIQLTELKNTMNNSYAMISNLENTLKAKREEYNKLNSTIEVAKREKVKRTQMEMKYTLLKEATSKESDKLSTLNSRKVEIEVEINRRLDALNSNTDINQELESLTQQLNALDNQGNSIKVSGAKYDEKMNYYKDLGRKINAIKDTKQCAINSNIRCLNGDSFNESLKQLSGLFNECMAEKNKLIEEYNKIGTSYKSIDSQKRDLLNKSQANQRVCNEHRDIIATLRNEVTSIENSIKEFEKKKYELEVVEDFLRNTKSISDTSLQEKILLTKRNEIVELEEQFKAEIKGRENLILIERNELEREQKQQKLDQYKLCEKTLSDIKLKIINSGIGPFVGTMNEILSQIGFRKKAFIETDKKKVVYGLVNEGNMKITFESLSKGESLIFLISLIAAMYQDHQGLKILALDNIENLDVINLDILLGNIDILKNYFDNILLIGAIKHIDFANYMDKINLINL
ncbi:MAG: hypothetical protein RR620_08605 [Clostridium sp.]